MEDELLLNAWVAATQAEIGICLTIDADDRKWFLNNLYRVRKENWTEELEEIIVFLPPNPEEIFLCKKQTNL